MEFSLNNFKYGIIFEKKATILFRIFHIYFVVAKWIKFYNFWFHKKNETFKYKRFTLLNIDFSSTILELKYFSKKIMDLSSSEEGSKVYAFL